MPQIQTFLPWNLAKKWSVNILYEHFNFVPIFPTSHATSHTKTQSELKKWLIPWLEQIRGNRLAAESVAGFCWRLIRWQKRANARSLKRQGSQYNAMSGKTLGKTEPEHEFWGIYSRDWG